MSREMSVASMLGSVDDLASCSERVEAAAGDRTIVWRRWGQGPCVVLLHGGAGSWTHWTRNISHLASRFTVLAPDMPGFGESDDAPPGATPERLAQLLAQSLEAVMPPQQIATLVAFSFGCIVAGYLAEALPWRFARLVLVGPTGLGVERAQQLDSGVQGAFSDALRHAHRNKLGELVLQDQAAVDQFAIDVQTLNVAPSRFITQQASRSDELSTLLPTLDIPITAIWGSRDVTASGQLVELTAAFEAVCACAQVIIIDGAGHWVQYEAAERFNVALALVLEAP